MPACYWLSWLLSWLDCSPSTPYVLLLNDGNGNLFFFFLETRNFFIEKMKANRPYTARHGQTQPGTDGPLWLPRRGTEQEKARRSISFLSATWYGRMLLLARPNFNSKIVSSLWEGVVSLPRELLSYTNLPVLFPYSFPSQHNNITPIEKIAKVLKQAGL